MAERKQPYAMGQRHSSLRGCRRQPNEAQLSQSVLQGLIS